MYRGAIENIALLIILGTNPRIGIIWWRIFGIANPEMQIRVHKCLDEKLIRDGIDNSNPIRLTIVSNRV